MVVDTGFNRYALKLVTAPTVEPVSRTEAKLHCRVDITDDDALIDTLITAAREYCEVETDRSFINTTWDLVFDSFPDTIYIPRSPLSSVTSITYLDTAGASTTLSSTLYTTDSKGEPGRIVPAYGETWPATYAIVNAVTVRVVIGYGSASTSVPSSIIAAIKLLVGHWYQNRQAVVTGTIASDVPMAVESLLMRVKVGAL